MRSCRVGLSIVIAICITAGGALAARANRHDEFRAAMKLARDGDLQADWNKMMDARGRFVRFASYEELSALAHYYLGYTYWRLSSLAFMAAGPTAQAPLLERAVAELETAIQKRPEFPDAHALLASCLAIWISADGSLREQLIPRIGAAWKQVPADTDNPRVMLLRGINLTFAPPPYGNREKGLALWRQAIDTFKTARPASLSPDWGEAEAIAWLGGFYLMSNQYTEAVDLLQRALRIRPDFWWVDKIALPNAKRPIRPITMDR